MTATTLSRICGLAVLLLVASAASAAPPTTQPAEPSDNQWLLHLPGIGGEMQIDHNLVNGLKSGGYKGAIEIYDWTEHDPGLDALVIQKRHQEQAAMVARMIEKQLQPHPNLQITLTSHSAGTGIAIWALEKLPKGMQVQSLFLIASALSPEYDLSKALKHVRGKAYLLYSEHDTFVLGTGTCTFGTVDGVKCKAAGLVGFTPPKDADKQQYEKLVQMPYDKAWMIYHNDGSHIGCMSRSFACNIIAPIVLDAAPPPTRTAQRDDKPHE